MESKEKGQNNRSMEEIQATPTTDAPNRRERPNGPRFQAALLHKIRRRFPCRNEWEQGRSRGSENLARKLPEKRTPPGTLGREDTGDQCERTGSVSGIRHQTLVREAYPPLPYAAGGENTTHWNLSTQPPDASGQNHQIRPGIRRHEYLARKAPKQTAQPQ